MREEYYNIVKPFILPIVLGITFIAAIILFKPPFYIILSALMLITIIFSIKQGLKTIIKNTLTAFLFIMFIHYLYIFLGAWGIIGITLGTIFITLIIIYRRRKLFMKTIRDIEIMIWGHTNDRKSEKDN